MTDQIDTPVQPHELHISQVFNAPRALVFAAWTSPGHLANWMGPQDFTVLHTTLDVRPGGQHRACLRAPDGSEHWARGEYLEVTAPERLRFTHCWENAAGEPGPATQVTVTLTAQGERTLMQFVQTGFESASSRAGHATGWDQSFARLRRYLQARES